MSDKVRVDVTTGDRYLEVPRTSPFVQTAGLEDEDSNFYYDPAWECPFEYTFQPGDKMHTVTAADDGRPDLIAWRYYRDVKLWWIIAWVNRVLHPINEIRAGIQLIIPSLEHVREYLSQV